MVKVEDMSKKELEDEIKRLTDLIHLKGMRDTVKELRKKVGESE